jgi:integrase
LQEGLGPTYLIPASPDEAGADPKSVQGQMRHSRITTTMDIYAQHAPESQRRAMVKMMEMVASRRAQAEHLQSTAVN